MDKHLKSAMHITACKADRLKGLSHPSLMGDDATIGSQILLLLYTFEMITFQIP